MSRVEVDKERRKKGEDNRRRSRDRKGNVSEMEKWRMCVVKES